MTTRGLIIGRYQPPHLGHLAVIQHALEQVDEVIVGIAAAQISHTLKNPLTAGERVELMRVMLDNAGIDPKRYWIVPTQDIMDNALWVAHLKRLLPRFDIFFGNNPFTDLLFSEYGIECRTTPMFEREKFEASRIRDLIIKQKSVEDFLDTDVARLLKEFGIPKRMRGIIESDKNFENTNVGSELANL
ncbi:MAG: nicotinamide-nucleotide adenylyltransferase [Candidatus Kariarchaeaceae archaeon]